MSIRELLLEIGTEEIPAWMIEPALDHLRRLLLEGLKKLRLGDEEDIVLATYATPRRLVAYVPALPAKQPDTEELLTGPPKAAPPQAAESFARKMSADASRLTTVSTPKGEYWAFRRREKGKNTEALLKELLPEVVLGIHFPKTMYWAGKGGPRFIRPIRSLLALYGGRVVPFSIAGVASGGYTFGHRTLGKARLKVTSFAQYVSALRKNGVLLKPAERREKILADARRLLQRERNGLKLRDNPELLNTLVYLTEFPTAALGQFDRAYLELPEEVLVTVMQHHQKYLSVSDASGRLAPRFLFVMNLDADRAGSGVSLIRHGNERVLRARFNDARFFWEIDQKIPLRDRLPMLEHVTFQSQLGNYRQKTERNAVLVRRLARYVPQAPLDAAVRAAELAKCDLTTELVKEFTELQGIVGGLYARAQGEPAEVADAIYDHYKPESMEDRSPRTAAGALVALTDKLDTLAGCFSIGLKPSGSSDPFALRRAAQGVVKILADYNCHAGFYNLSKEALDLLGVSDQTVLQELKLFFVDRLRYFLREVRGFAYDEVDAVLAVGADDVIDAINRCVAVARVRPTENFEPLAMGFKRIHNILLKSGGIHQFRGQPDESGFVEDAERNLYVQALRIREAWPNPFGQTGSSEEYESELVRTADLRSYVDAFFDKVLVMEKDENLKRNRLELLAFLLKNFKSVADISKIVTTKEKEHQHG